MYHSLKVCVNEQPQEVATLVRYVHTHTYTTAHSHISAPRSLLPPRHHSCGARASRKVAKRHGAEASRSSRDGGAGGCFPPTTAVHACSCRGNEHRSSPVPARHTHTHSHPPQLRHYAQTDDPTNPAVTSALRKNGVTPVRAAAHHRVCADHLTCPAHTSAATTIAMDTAARRLVTLLMQMPQAIAIACQAWTCLMTT